MEKAIREKSPREKIETMLELLAKDFSESADFLAEEKDALRQILETDRFGSFEQAIQS